MGKPAEQVNVRTKGAGQFSDIEHRPPRRPRKSPWLSIRPNTQSVFAVIVCGLQKC